MAPHRHRGERRRLELERPGRAPVDRPVAERRQLPAAGPLFRRRAAGLPLVCRLPRRHRRQGGGHVRDPRLRDLVRHPGRGAGAAGPRAGAAAAARARRTTGGGAGGRAGGLRRRAGLDAAGRRRGRRLRRPDLAGDRQLVRQQLVRLPGRCGVALLPHPVGDGHRAAGPSGHHPGPADPGRRHPAAGRRAADARRAETRRARSAAADPGGRRAGRPAGAVPLLLLPGVRRGGAAVRRHRAPPAGCRCSAQRRPAAGAVHPGRPVRRRPAAERQRLGGAEVLPRLGVGPAGRRAGRGRLLLPHQPGSCRSCWPSAPSSCAT